MVFTGSIHAPGDHFILNQSIGKLAKGNRGVVMGVDHIRNKLAVRIFKDGGQQDRTIDLTENGHHLSIFERSKQEFAAGDNIVFLRNDRKLGVQNGLTGKITDIRDDGQLTVLTGDQQEVTFNSKEYGFFDYAYGFNSHKIQGSERDSVIFNGDSRKYVNFQSFYVAASRARQDISIFTDNKEKKELIFPAKLLY